jgi:lipopolysaccharide export system permease protein
MRPDMQDYPQTQEQKSKRPFAGASSTGIFRRSLVREFAGLGLLVFSLLLGIVVLSQLIRLLSDAVSGVLTAEGVPVLMGFAALNYLPVLLSLSLFLSVLLTLSRCYRDSEMVVWFSSGVGLTRWIGPVLWYALPVVGVIALLSLVLSPWALTKAEDYRQRLSNREDMSAVTPGVFRESGSGDRVYFIEKVDRATNHIGNIFVQATMHGEIDTVAAQEGKQETAPNGDRFLVLLNGTRYEGVPGDADFKIVQFERYAMRIETEEASKAVPKLQSRSTLSLLSQPDSWSISELEWRVSLPLAALVLALLAIPLSFVNPRAGRSFNLIVALVVYMVYSNSISVSNSWVGQQRIGPVAGFLIIHLAMFAAAAGLFHYRLSVFSWRRLLR